jgi:hypothetical protein
MKKTLFNREDIEKIVRLVPRPMMNGKFITRSRNFWFILKEYGDQEGVEILNKITNHSGKIPFDSIREWREPDMLILSAQVNVGRDGLFELSPFLDGPESEMLTEDEAFLPERLNFVKNQLDNLTETEIKVLTRLVVQVRMTTNEILIFCRSIGLSDVYAVDTFFTQLMQKTQMIEKDDPHRPLFTAWIKDGFAPILQYVLLDSQRGKSAIVR